MFIGDFSPDSKNQIVGSLGIIILNMVNIVNNQVYMVNNQVNMINMVNMVDI